MAMTKRDQRQKMNDTDSAARTIIAQEASSFKQASNQVLRGWKGETQMWPTGTGKVSLSELTKQTVKASVSDWELVKE